MSLALFGLYGRQTVYAIQQTIHVPLENRIPSNTFQWIRLHTPLDAFVMSPQSASLTLYTDRYSTAYIGGVADPDHFRFLLLESGITHLCTRPYSFLHVRAIPFRDPQFIWPRIESYLKEDMSSYESIYRNDSERTEIYRVRSSAEFQRAYRLYRTTMRTFADTPIGRRSVNTLDELEVVLRLYPFPSALNAFGATALLMNRHLELAQKRLEEAVRRRPDFAVAWENLARACTRNGDTKGAQKAYKKIHEITLTIQASPVNKHP
jgi:tetratricopeptide (TPR) repeat protein